MGGNGSSITYDYEYDAIGNMLSVNVSRILLDTDQDGLPDYIEIQNACLGLNDAGSDDDGIIDGLEDADKDGNFGLADNETDPCDADTDGDGILDGTEIGLTKDDIGPDTDERVFVADADPDSVTDPINPDTVFYWRVAYRETNTFSISIAGKRQITVFLQTTGF